MHSQLMQKIFISTPTWFNLKKWWNYQIMNLVKLCGRFNNKFQFGWTCLISMREAWLQSTNRFSYTVRLHSLLYTSSDFLSLTVNSHEIHTTFFLLLTSTFKWDNRVNNCIWIRIDESSLGNREAEAHY